MAEASEETVLAAVVREGGPTIARTLVMEEGAAVVARSSFIEAMSGDSFFKTTS